MQGAPDVGPQPPARATGRPRGRPQRPGVERLVKLLAVLAAVQDPAGVPRDRLLAGVGDYPADPEHASQTLQRDVLWLKESGWRIETVGEPGQAASYRLVPGDPRLRLLLSRDELSALRWALAAVGTGWLDDLLAQDAPELARRPPTYRVWAGLPESLDDVLMALQRRATITVDDGDGRRVLEPVEVTGHSGDWLLVARSLATGRLDLLLVEDLSQVEVGAAGSAPPAAAVTRPGSDPCTWLVDPPVLARVQVRPDQTDVVARFLGGHVEPARLPDVVRVQVTNREAFRARLLLVGQGARLIEPPDLVAAVVGDLDAVLHRSRTHD